MILELIRDKEILAEAFLGESVEMRTLTAEAFLVKNLDEITDAEELVTALR